MKVWRCSYHGDSDFGTVQSWHRTRKTAMAARIDLFDDPECVEVEMVEIPTNKNGIITWLNRNFNTNNG